ncbi:MAG: hypothetical protein AMJ58_10660 [Gammaproteobacteria bacterium SG8_30]|nr:MAG: hypothetical protein AMJ58_10660 [Gammaproteobacteria bacterium SG8_30]
MIDNVNTFINELKTSDFGKATRKSAENIWKANMNAWTTTRDELGKVVDLAFREGGKLTKRSRARTEKAVDRFEDVASERVNEVNERFQEGMNRVIHGIGLPTADEVEKLSRKVDRLSREVKVKAKTKTAAKRRAPRRKTAKRKAA